MAEYRFNVRHYKKNRNDNYFFIFLTAEKETLKLKLKK